MIKLLDETNNGYKDMVEKISEDEFCLAVTKFAHKTKFMPWANPTKHQEHITKEMKRLMGWVPDEKKDRYLQLGLVALKKEGF